MWLWNVYRKGYQCDYEMFIEKCDYETFIGKGYQCDYEIFIEKVTSVIMKYL